MLARGIFPLTSAVLVGPLIGYRTFLRWAMEARFYPASRCKKLGLLTDVAPARELGTRVRDLAARIAGYSAPAVDLGIRALVRLERGARASHLKEIEPLLAENLAQPLPALGRPA
jgi:enoyl-CoA hydratase/carnithine racemase